MQTLISPKPHAFSPGLPSCEQVLPGSDTGEDEDGEIGSGTSQPAAEPQPLQGESDGQGGDGTTQHNE